MTTWPRQLKRTLDRGDNCVLVTVTGIKGSAPREIGTRMIVTADGQSGTIGGGQLEYQAAGDARDMLSSGRRTSFKTYALGPNFHQCCGGVVTLLFEPLTVQDAAWVGDLVLAGNAPKPHVLLTKMGPGEDYLRACINEVDEIENMSAEVGQACGELLASSTQVRFQVLCGDDASIILERLEDHRQPLWLFGAGHVGHAVVCALARLPFRITWIDSRASLVACPPAEDVETITPEHPASILDEAPPGTMFLVMTHSHELDQDICEAILRRGDASYLGLIGSDTKRTRFVHRLRDKGLDETALNSLICPIGLDGITGKQPDIIAASVAAELLLRLERLHHEADQVVENAAN